jgi:PAS domain-containing protein
VILIRRFLLLLLLAAAGAVAVYLGIRGYLLLRDATGLDPQELRSRGESFLYLAVVFATFIGIFVLSILLRSRNITRELDKVVDIARHGSFSFGESLKRLGPLGPRIQSLNARLTDLNEKRSLRISSMAAINAFLLNNIRLQVLITDITGKLTGVSPRAAEKLGIERLELVGRFINDVLEEVDFQAVVSRLEKERVELTTGDDRNPIAYYPVMNRNNELSNVICVVGKEEVLSPVASRGEERSRGNAAGVSRVASFVRKALRRRG